MLNRDDVAGLFFNVFRRPPSEADLQAHCRASSIPDLAKAFMESPEFLGNLVREVYRWWLKRPPVDREVAEWSANFRRLGQIGGCRHLTATKESLSHCIDPGQPGSIVPPDLFWSGTQYGNALIRWYKHREPHEPREGLRYALMVQVGSGVFSGFQMHDLVAGEDDTTVAIVKRNYEVLLGRQMTPGEIVHWRTLARQNLWLYQIAASPEGIAHGLSLSRQRSVEPLAVADVPPAPEAIQPTEIPPGFFSFSGAA